MKQGGDLDQRFEIVHAAEVSGVDGDEFAREVPARAQFRNRARVRGMKSGGSPVGRNDDPRWRDPRETKGLRHRFAGNEAGMGGAPGGVAGGSSGEQPAMAGQNNGDFRIDVLHPVNEFGAP